MVTASSSRVRLAVTAVICAVVATAALMPSAAQAYWVRGWGWRPGIVVVGPPVYGPPRPYYYAPRPAHWVHGHYTYYGAWVPGHWA